MDPFYDIDQLSHPKRSSQAPCNFLNNQYLQPASQKLGSFFIFSFACDIPRDKDALIPAIGGKEQTIARSWVRSAYLHPIVSKHLILAITGPDFCGHRCKLRVRNGLHAKMMELGSFFIFMIIYDIPRHL